MGIECVCARPRFACPLTLKQNALTVQATICKVTNNNKENQGKKTTTTKMIQSKRFFKHFLRATCLWQILFSLFLFWNCSGSTFIVYCVVLYCCGRLLKYVVSVYFAFVCKIVYIYVNTTKSLSISILLSIFRIFNTIQFDRIKMNFIVFNSQEKWSTFFSFNRFNTFSYFFFFVACVYMYIFFVYCMLTFSLLF